MDRSVENVRDSFAKQARLLTVCVDWPEVKRVGAGELAACRKRIAGSGGRGLRIEVKYLGASRQTYSWRLRHKRPLAEVHHPMACKPLGVDVARLTAQASVRALLDADSRLIGTGRA